MKFNPWYGKTASFTRIADDTDDYSAKGMAGFRYGFNTQYQASKGYRQRLATSSRLHAMRFRCDRGRIINSKPTRRGRSISAFTNGIQIACD